MSEPPRNWPHKAKDSAYIIGIDGLRAVAVLSVMFYHIGWGIVPGGFIGVDVFFVISGFLITGQIVKAFDGGAFSYRDFYQRRVARIAPAAIVVVVLTLAAGIALYDNTDKSALGSDVVAASLAGMNIKQIAHEGYFKTQPDTRPLIHYWSLALEEQFYIVFPAVIGLIYRFARQRRLAIIMALCAAGFAASVVLTRLAPVAAFYLLPSRAWELLAGAAVAVMSGERKLLAGGGRRMIDAGLVVIGLGLWLCRGSGFPGWIAILPVGGTALVLAGMAAESGRSLGEGLLTSRPMVFCGRISYSLYLWHWPVFSFVSYSLFQQPPFATDALKVGLSLAGAVLSFYLVEQPARRLLRQARYRAAAFIGFAVISGLIAVAGWELHTHAYLTAPAGSIEQGGIALGDPRAPSVVLIGDSEATTYGAELRRIAQADGLRLNVLAASGENELPGEAGTWWPRIAAYLGPRNYDVGVVAEAWAMKRDSSGPLGCASHLAAALPFLRQHFRHIVVIGQIPQQPTGATRPDMARGALPPFREAAVSRANRERANADLRALTSAQVTLIDPSDQLIGGDGSIRMVAPNGRLSYFDSEHLSSSGAHMVARGLQPALHQALAR